MLAIGSKYEDDTNTEPNKTVRQKHPLWVDVSGKQSQESQLSPEIEPVAIELSLPWKRTVEPIPISSSLSHSMAGDENPQMCEVPSWADNFSYTAHAPSPTTSVSSEKKQTVRAR